MSVQASIDAAFAALARGDHGAAAQHARAVLAADRNNPAALTVIGKLALAAQRPDVARDVFTQILAIDSSHAETWIDLAQALADMREDDAALEAAQAAIERDPRNILGPLKLGEVLIAHNRMADARAAFERALSLDPADARALAGLARAAAPKPGDPLVARLQARLKGGGLDPRGRAQLHYGLMQAFKGADDARFIEHLLAANAAQREAAPKTEEPYAQMFARLEKGFSAEAFARAATAKANAPKPIFILGMPRSGTTLVEQMLAAHADVVAGGELNYMRGPLTAALSAATKQPFPLGFETLDAAALTALADGFRRRIALIAKGAPIVTDKTPGNYHLLGLLAHLFPDAAIIHTARDPMDTGFSILQYPFDERSPHTFDMGLLGAHYRHYAQMMAHWERLFPGRFLTVPYEALVADPKGVGAQLFAHCGLDWSDRYLSFHENAGPVRTFSAEQVRRPVYASSVGAWTRYAEALQPLKDALGA